MKIGGRNKLLLMHFIRLPDDHVVDLNQNYDDQNLDQWTLKVDIVQDFLIKLGIKPCMHLVEISIFSLKTRQTYQNYEQIRKKLGIFLENKAL